jgi:hypothetical protein
MADKPTARQRIERAFHVSFKTPEQAAELLDAYRDQVLTEAAELLVATARRRHGAIGPQYRCVSDDKRLHEWLEAAKALLAARSTTDQED